MSVTVTAVPFYLIAALGSIIDAAGVLVKGTGFNYQQKETLHIDEKTLQELSKKEFKTQITDKETLIKTLEEHGAVNIEEQDQVISCECEAFYLTFFKKDNETAYIMNAAFNEELGLDNLVRNLGDEYTINAQEASYNKIKERLKEKNMSISDEEIYDDDTIVLTIDLD